MNNLGGPELTFIVVILLLVGGPLYLTLRRGGSGTQIVSSSSETIAAGFWRRLAAFTIDVLILSGIAAAAEAIFPRIRPSGYEWILGFALPSVYFATGWRFGATVGMRILGLRLVDEQGSHIGIGTALLRTFCLWVVVGVCATWIGLLVYAVNRRRHRPYWHDTVTKTLVIRTRSQPSAHIRTPEEQALTSVSNPTQRATSGWTSGTMVVVLLLVMASVASGTLGYYIGRQNVQVPLPTWTDREIRATGTQNVGTLRCTYHMADGTVRVRESVIPLSTNAAYDPFGARNPSSDRTPECPAAP